MRVLRPQSRPDVAATGRSVAAERTARAALSTDESTALIADAPLEPVLRGVSNWAWRAATPTGDYFVRLARLDTERLGADHLNECRLLEAVAARGIAPPVVRCDAARRLLVTRWIDDANGGAPVRDAARLVTAAAALAQLHSLAPVTALRRVDFAAQARELEAVLHAPDETNAFSRTAAAVFERLELHAGPPRLCHNDLHPLNLLFELEGRLWLVDWEYAGLGDPIFDLASCASQHGLGAPQRARLAGIYNAAGGQVEPQRLEMACWAFDYVQWLWYRAALAQESLGEPGRDTKTLRNRASRIGASLRRRASSLLRCNNRGLQNS